MLCMDIHLSLVTNLIVIVWIHNIEAFSMERRVLLTRQKDGSLDCKDSRNI